MVKKSKFAKRSPTEKYDFMSSCWDVLILCGRCRLHPIYMTNAKKTLWQCSEKPESWTGFQIKKTAFSISITGLMFRSKTQMNHLCPAFHLSIQISTILFSLHSSSSLSGFSASPLHPPHPQMFFILVLHFLFLLRPIIIFLGSPEVSKVIKMSFC